MSEADSILDQALKFTVWNQACRWRIQTWQNRARCSCEQKLTVCEHIYERFMWLSPWSRICYGIARIQGRRHEGVVSFNACFALRRSTSTWYAPPATFVPFAKASSRAGPQEQGLGNWCRRLERSLSIFNLTSNFLLHTLKALTATCRVICTS